MMRNGQRTAAWAAAFCLATLAWVGCGADGTSSASLQNNPQSGPVVSGTVYAPDGQFSAVSGWRRWADALSLWPSAYANLSGESPINSVEDVSLSLFDPAAAAHGCKLSPPPCTDPVAGGSTRTDAATGTYQITNSVLTDEVFADATVADLVVLVGPQDLLTRAFVLSRTTNVDAVSEAIVRLVLNRLPEAPVVSLNDFTIGRVKYLDCLARPLVEGQGISGISVSDVNENVYTALANSPTMQQAMDCITGVQSACVPSMACPPPS